MDRPEARPPIETDKHEEMFIEKHYRSIYKEDYDKEVLNIERPISKWHKLVYGLSVGRYLGYDSYGNSLSARATIQYFLDLDESPESLKDKIRKVVEPLDEEFKRFTRPRRASYLLHDSDPSRWWLFREPMVDVYGNPIEKLPE